MNKLRKIRASASGFTLIELLIVIVIIGILAGVLLTVIDPARQQRKAREAVLRTNVEKGCLALFACGVTSNDPDTCDIRDEAGILAKANVDGTPTGATYGLSDTAGGVDGDVSVTGGANDNTVYYRGTLNTCRFQCGYNFDTAATIKLGAVTAAGVADSTVCVVGNE